MKEKDEASFLISRFKNGDNDAFVLLINLVRNDVYKVIYAIIQNEQNSLEVFDEVIYKAYINLKKIKHNEFFKTWLIRISINESRNYIKKNSKIVYLSEYDEPTKSENSEIKLDMEQALNMFDVDTKSILIMKLYLDYTFEDIANDLSKPVSTIKSIYYTNLEKLKKYLGKEEVN